MIFSASTSPRKFHLQRRSRSSVIFSPSAPRLPRLSQHQHHLQLVCRPRSPEGIIPSRQPPADNIHQDQPATKLIPFTTKTLDQIGQAPNTSPSSSSPPRPRTERSSPNKNPKQVGSAKSIASLDAKGPDGWQSIIFYIITTTSAQRGLAPIKNYII